MNNPSEAFHSGKSFFSIPCSQPARGDARNHVDFVSGVWSALAAEVVGLPTLPRHGLSVYELGAVTIRFIFDESSGSMALERVDLAAQDAFELFLLQLADGPKAGWRRKCRGPVTAPECWSDFAILLPPMNVATARAEPDFASLVAAFSGGTKPSVAFDDLETQVALEAELAHFRALSSDQAKALRDSRAAQMALREALGSTSPSDEGPVPESCPIDSLETLPVWASEHADKILILPRALGAAKKSTYEDPALVFRALEILAFDYPRVRSGEIRREDLKTICDREGLFVGGSVDEGRANGEYYVQYGGRRRWMDQHVGAGTSRNPAHCLRIYWFWDEESRKVVVGWLPSHLTNSLT